MSDCKQQGKIGRSTDMYECWVGQPWTAAHSIYLQYEFMCLHTRLYMFVTGPGHLSTLWTYAGEWLENDSWGEGRTCAHKVHRKM